MFVEIGSYVGIFFLCLWAADFLTGIVHWAEDTYCKSRYPIISALIFEPNKLHHQDPNLIVRTGNFLSRNCIQWLVWFLSGKQPASPLSGNRTAVLTVPHRNETLIQGN